MGKNHSSVVVLRIRLKFWWMLPMGATTQSMSQKLNGGGRERASQVPDFHFKICHLGPKSAFFCPKPLLNLLKTVVSVETEV